MLTGARPRPSLDLRFVPTRTLLDDLDGWRWTLSEIDAAPESWDHAASTAAYVQVKIDLVQEEIDRRKAVMTNRHAPDWPKDVKSRRAEVADLKRRMPIAEVIEHYAPVVFRQQGKHLVCSCPFLHHRDDGTASFTVYVEQQSFYCFGCCVGGDVFEFLRHYLALSHFPEAVDVLRAMAGTIRTSPEIVPRTTPGSPDQNYPPTGGKSSSGVVSGLLGLPRDYSRLSRGSRGSGQSGQLRPRFDIDKDGIVSR